MKDMVLQAYFATDFLYEIWKCHIFFKTWRIAKKSNSLYSTIATSVLIKCG